MRKHPVLVAGAALLVALALTWCFAPKSLRAQVANLVPTSFNGFEVLVAQLQGPGGSSEYVTTGMLRNTTGVVTTAATSGTITWPGSQSANGAQYTNIITTAACGGAATFNLPAKPFDGQRVVLVNGSGGAWTTGCVVAATDGATIVNQGTIGALAAGASVEFVYVLANTTWYRTR